MQGRLHRYSKDLSYKDLAPNNDTIQRRNIGYPALVSYIHNAFFHGLMKTITLVTYENFLLLHRKIECFL